MPTLTIGRFSMSDGPTAIRHDGNNLDLDLQIDAATTSSVTVAKVLRQQLLGLAENPDEPVVPVTWDDDTDLNGYYVVEGVSCEPFEMFLNNGTMTASVSLRRVAGGYAFPQTELITASLTRTNAHGLTGEALVASYTNVSNAIRDATPWLANTLDRTSADSATAIRVLTAVPTLAPLAWSSWVPTSLYYVGACRIEVNIGGTWYTVVGTQISANDNWRITNGIVRLSSGDAASPGTIEVWNGSAWESRNIRHYTSSGAAENIGLAYESDRSPVFVLRNSPERVTVRCAGNSFRVEYSVQRGAMHVEMFSSIVYGIGLDSSHAAGCTAITGGIRATSNDANGNQIVFGIAQGNTTTLATGSMYNSAGAPTSMMVGVALNGSSAATRDTPAEIMKQFIGVSPVKQRIVTR